MTASHSGLRGRAFVGVVLAQLLSALADNALLIAAIALLAERAAAPWMAPALRISFYAAYLLLAPVAGRVADALPKNRVLLGTAIARLLGCLLLLAGVHPLLAYGLIGAAAAAGGPARYGILPHILTPRDLVAGNAWLEGVTVAAILFGVGLGSVLLDGVGLGAMAGVHGGSHAVGDLIGHTAGHTAGQTVGQAAAQAAAQASDHVIGHATSHTAVAAIAVIYMFAVLASLLIPRVALRSTARDRHNPHSSGDYLRTFWRCQQRLWRDRLGGIAMAVTCLFWAMAAVLQFLVLRWGEQIGHFSLAASSLLQLPVALGMIAGAACAGGRIRITRAPHLVPLGVLIGALVMALALVREWRALVALLSLVGVLSGLLLIPMNALLQHRGHALMASGQSIAVQSFGENLAAVVLLSIYGVLVAAGLSVAALTVACGAAVVATVALILYWRQRQQAAPLPA